MVRRCKRTLALLIALLAWSQLAEAAIKMRKFTWKGDATKRAQRMPRLTLGHGLHYSNARNIPAEVARAVTKRHQSAKEAQETKGTKKSPQALKQQVNALAGLRVAKPSPSPPAPLVPFTEEQAWIPTYLDTVACGDFHEPTTPNMHLVVSLPPPPLPPPSPPPPTPEQQAFSLMAQEFVGRKLRFDLRLDEDSAASDWSDKVYNPNADDASEMVGQRWDDDLDEAEGGDSAQSASAQDSDKQWLAAHSDNLPDQTSLTAFCSDLFDVQERIINKVVRHEQRDMWHALHGRDISAYEYKHRPHREVLLAGMEADRLRELPFNKDGDEMPRLSGALAFESADQRRVLLAIRDASARKGSSLWGWEMKEHYCTWEGVVCDGRGKIINLEFAEKQLYGTLPSHLSRLSALQILDLSSNAMTGTLPRQLSVLSDLDTLNLARNRLEGSLPVPWSALAGLEQLDMRSNRLEGTLPRLWSAMTELQDLDLSGNRLVGSLPPIWVGMKSLEYINLGANALNGSLPIAWSNLTQMRGIQLQDNRLTGNLPVSMSALLQLKRVALQNNRLGGALPKAWESLQNLEYLNVEGNRMSGLLPSWNRMNVLRHLLLSNNQFHGDLPRDWGRFKLLHRLEAANNTLVGRVPPQWSKLEYLHYVELEGNNLLGKWSKSTIDRSINNLYGVKFVAGQTSFIPFD